MIESMCVRVCVRVLSSHSLIINILPLIFITKAFARCRGSNGALTAANISDRLNLAAKL